MFVHCPAWGQCLEHVMAHSPHRRHKGCRLCKPHKFADLGRAQRDPWTVRRQLGTKRRAGRHDVPADQLD
jgi:hypothetical protein